MTKTTYLLRYGVLAIGLPLAVLLNVLVVLTHDGGAYWSVRNAFELTYTVMLLAPPLGVLVGSRLWGARVRRSAAMVPDAAAPWAAPAPSPAAAPIPVPRRPGPSEAAGPEAAAAAAQKALGRLSEQVQRLAAMHPGRLRRRVVLFTILGYGYLLGGAFLLAGATVWLFVGGGRFEGITSRLAYFPMAFALVAFQAVFVRSRVPTGRRVTRAGSPALLDTLAKIARTVNAPEPEAVLLTDEFNASVTEIPRFGFIGLPKRYLCVGLPLLEMLSTPEVTAVLAHEMAHLARGDSESHTWVARLNVSWQSLSAHLEATAQWGRYLFLPFFRWYAPRYAIYGQALSRVAEHDSDALAARCAGADATATALLRLHVYQHFLSERFFPSVYGKSAESAEPPAGVLEAMSGAMRRDAAPDDLLRWTRDELAERSLDSQSHPCLYDRLASIGRRINGDEQIQSLVEHAIRRGGQGAAADLFTAPRIAKLSARLDADWQGSVLPRWRIWNACAKMWQAPAPHPADEDFALWAHARWASECAVREDAVPWLRQALTREPNDADIEFRLGTLLIASADAAERAEGIALLERGAARQNRPAKLACGLLRAHYGRTGSQADVIRTATRARLLDDMIAASLRERMYCTAEDLIEGCSVPAQVLAALRGVCAAVPAIRQGYVIRKQTEHLRDQTLLVFALDCEVPWYRPTTSTTAPREFAQAVERRIPFRADVDRMVVLIGGVTGLRSRLLNFPSAEFYSGAGMQ